jgi:hypothetical protein
LPANGTNKVPRILQVSVKISTSTCLPLNLDAAASAIAASCANFIELGAPLLFHFAA